MKNRALSLAGLIAVVALGACDSDSTTAVNTNLVTFKATLTPAAEIPTPVVSSTGSGLFTATLDTVTGQFVYDLTFTGLTSPVNNGHIHGPADATATSGAALNFNTLPGAQFSFNAAAGTGHGTIFLTSAVNITTTMKGDSLRKLLLAGLTYANIHTTSNGAGEIRGQILKQ